VAGLPVIRFGAVRLQHRIGHEQACRLHVDDEFRVRMQGGDIAASMTPTLSAKISLPCVVDDAATVAVAIEAEADIGAVLQHRVTDGMQHLHVFRIGIVARESVVELDIERDDFAADALPGRFGRKGARRAVAASGNDLERAA
jgi:hypothetical protein